MNYYSYWKFFFRKKALKWNIGSSAIAIFFISMAIDSIYQIGPNLGDTLIIIGTTCFLLGNLYLNFIGWKSSMDDTNKNPLK